MRLLALLMVTAAALRAQAGDCSARTVQQMERDFQQAVKSRDRDRILNQAYALAQRYELGGQRQQLRELVKRVTSMRGAAGWGDALRNLRARGEVFAAYPDQAIAAKGASRLNYAYVDRKLTVPLSINGAPANYVLDTGAPTNFLSAAEAKRLGLTVHPAPLVVGYIFNEPKQGGITIVDDLVIGNLHLRNVLFEVGAEGLPGVLGLPLILAMETMRWNSDGSLEFPVAPGPGHSPEPNLCLFGAMPMVQTEITGRPALFALDTGSDMTLLFPRFTRDFNAIASAATPGNEVVFGDAVKDPNARLIEEMFLTAGGLRLRAANAVLLSKDINGPTPAHGLLGMDVLEQSRSVTLDFTAMRMTAEGIVAAPAAASGEIACPLPSGYACAEGSRCTIQTDADNQICLLERAPRTAWPGNPVIDDALDGGKLCELEQKLACPAEKSCRAIFQSNQSCSFVIQDAPRPVSETMTSAPTSASTSNQAHEIMQRVLEHDLFDTTPPRDYVFNEDHQTRHLNADGSVKDVTTETLEVMSLYDAEYSRLIRRNLADLPPSKARAEQAKFDKAVDRRAHETPEAKGRREQAERKQAAKNRACEDAILKAFDFRITGTENVNGRESWMIEADPLPHLATACTELTVLGWFKQRFWIDQADYRMAKWEGDTGSFHVGGILLRVPSEGIHFVFEQTRHDDGTWLPLRETTKMNARLLGVKTIHEEHSWTYSNYRKFGAESKLLP